MNIKVEDHIPQVHSENGDGQGSSGCWKKVTVTDDTGRPMDLSPWNDKILNNGKMIPGVNFITAYPSDQSIHVIIAHGAVWDEIAPEVERLLVDICQEHCIC